MSGVKHHIHGDVICPIYDEPVLPNEEGNCSLCDWDMETPVSEIIRALVEEVARAFKASGEAK